MAEFYAHNSNYTSEEECDSDFDTNYPLTWEIDHLTDVNSPQYNVDYISPVRSARFRRLPPVLNVKKNNMWKELRARNKHRYDASKKKNESPVQKTSTQTKLNFKGVKSKMD